MISHRIFNDGRVTMKADLKKVTYALALFFLISRLGINNADAQSLTFQYDSLKVVSDYRYPDDTDKRFTYVKIVYPVFADKVLDSLVMQTILSPLVVRHLFNSTLLTDHPALSSFDFDAQKSANYQSLADNFIQQFEKQVGTANRPVYWYADIRMTVETGNSGYISCLCKKEYFSGGLHSLYDYTYLNYDPIKYRILNLQSQIKPGTMEQLTKLGEAIFRKNEGLKPEDPLDGYFFTGNKFTLTTNFTIIGRGLKFIYVPYEIKPFAVGITTLIIPFKDLKTIIMPGSVLMPTMASMD